MKILGIDYGKKRIGISISDENSTLAFPYCVLENKENIIDEIKKIQKTEDFGKVVLGDPGENEIKKEVSAFMEDLKKAGFEVVFEKEFMTSFHTDIFTKTKPIARKEKKSISKKKDESAAALILQRYLDKNN